MGKILICEVTLKELRQFFSEGKMDPTLKLQ